MLISFAFTAYSNTSNKTESSSTQKNIETQIVEGIALHAENSFFVIVDDLPIVINNSDEYDLTGINSGDIVQLSVGAISETYPALANMWSECKVMQKGTIDNISNDVILQLEDCGYNIIEFMLYEDN